MTNFTVLTDEQAAHDAATSKRLLEALRELQAENARLRAHIRESCDLHDNHAREFEEIGAVIVGQMPAKQVVDYKIEFDRMWHKRHLAALGETN